VAVDAIGTNVLIGPRGTGMQMRLAGASGIAAGAGVELLPGRVNQFIGKNRAGWRTL
jgi:hypothetical protein